MKENVTLLFMQQVARDIGKFVIQPNHLYMQPQFIYVIDNK